MLAKTPRYFGRIVGILALCAFTPPPLTAAAAEDRKGPVGDLDVKMEGAKITRGAAIEAALKQLTGKVTDVTVERKGGRQVYVIEIVTEKDGKENDVLVDMQTGVVLGIED